MGPALDMRCCCFPTVRVDEALTARPLPVRQPASGSPVACRYEPGQDGKRDLGRSFRPDVEADRGLYAGDHVLAHAFGAQALKVMAGVPATADKSDELRLEPEDGLERVHDVECVVVGVN